MLFRKHTINAFVLVFLAFGSSFASNYADTFGASPTGISLGNAMAARVDDWSSVYYNMAGLGKAMDVRPEENGEGDGLKTQLAVSYICNRPGFSIDISRSRSDTGEPLATNGDKNLETGSLVLGGTLDINRLYVLPEWMSSARIGLLASFNDDRTVAKINDTSLQTHNFFRYGKETQTLIVMTGLGLGFREDTFGFGIGTMQSVGGKGRILASDVELSTEEQAPYMESQFEITLEKMPLFAGFYLDAGKLFSVLQGLSFGAAYREESYLDVDDFKTVTITAVGNIVMEINAAMFDYYRPTTFQAGMAWRIDRITVSADLEYRAWSGFRTSDISETAYTEGEEVVPIPELDDIIIPRLGIQYEWGKTTDFFLGYYYEASCVPDSAVNGIFNLLDNDRHVGSLGLAFRVPRSFPLAGGLRGPLDITLAYQYQKLLDRDVVKTDPTSENPDYSYGGDCHTMTIGVSYSL